MTTRFFSGSLLAMAVIGVLLMAGCASQPKPAAKPAAPAATTVKPAANTKAPAQTPTPTAANPRPAPSSAKPAVAPAAPASKSTAKTIAEAAKSAPAPASAKTPVVTGTTKPAPTPAPNAAANKPAAAAPAAASRPATSAPAPAPASANKPAPAPTAPPPAPATAPVISQPASLVRGKAGAVDIWITPLGNYPEAFVADLAEKLTRDTGLFVRVAPSAPLTEAMVAEDRRSLVVERIFAAVEGRLTVLENRKPETLHLLLTDQPITKEQATAGPLVAFNDKEKLRAVVSIALLRAIQNRVEVASITRQRAHKVALRQIGEAYLGLPPSRDPSNVMYGPLRSIADIDMIGTAFD